MEAPYEKDSLTDQIIGFAIEVHRHLGPGLLESAYEQRLCYELNENGMDFKRQVPLPVVYKWCGWIAVTEWTLLWRTA